MSKDHQTGFEGAVTQIEADGAHHNFRALVFDPAEFMHFVEDADLTEEQATELLRAIWDVVVAFVDLGFGIHPVQQAMDKSDRASRLSPADISSLLGSMDQIPDQDRKTVRAFLREAAKEDS